MQLRPGNRINGIRSRGVIRLNHHQHHQRSIRHFMVIGVESTSGHQQHGQQPNARHRCCTTILVLCHPCDTIRGQAASKRERATHSHCYNVSSKLGLSKTRHPRPTAVPYFRRVAGAEPYYRANTMYVPYRAAPLFRSTRSNMPKSHKAYSSGNIACLNALELSATAIKHNTLFYQDSKPLYFVSSVVGITSIKSSSTTGGTRRFTVFKIIIF